MVAFMVPSLVARSIVSNRIDCFRDSQTKDSPCLARRGAMNRDRSLEEVGRTKELHPLLLAALNEKTLDVLTE